MFVSPSPATKTNPSDAGGTPVQAESWLKPASLWALEHRGYHDEATVEEVRRYLEGKPWHWPSEHVIFLSDIHADADAFLRSLVASGGVRKHGPRDEDIELTPTGRDATFVIAGDCFDKGPNNFRLLRSVARLRATGARMRLLAGNHDVRALVGMLCAGERDPRLSHLWVRMGVKTLPLLLELVEQCDRAALHHARRADTSELQRSLFPTKRWYETFPDVAKGLMPAQKIEQELIRIREKTQEIQDGLADANLTLGHVAAAITKFRESFVEPTGELHWYFAETELAHRVGPLLFIHAGVDDHLAALLATDGVNGINAAYRRLVEQRRWFELYYGSIGNAFRTKYRVTDWPLTEAGVAALHRAGVYAVVHGHRNIHRGQRVIFRNGILNFECDASVDSNTRRREGLSGLGSAATVIDRDGRIAGISSDYPNIKVFDPAQHCQLLALT
jgi:Calcineurin-like phosphoesterase